jgi:hypothetical protein
METGSCLSKAWKPLICSLTDRRKPPSHDSRSGFSAGPRRSVHTVLMPSPGTLQPPPWCPGFLPLPLLPHSLPPHACDSLTWPLSFTRRFPAQRPLTLLPVVFPDRAIPNSCSLLPFVSSVVACEPRGYILFLGEPWELRSTVPLPSCFLCNPKFRLLFLLTTCFHSGILLGLFYPEDGGDIFLKTLTFSELQGVTSYKMVTFNGCTKISRRCDFDQYIILGCNVIQFGYTRSPKFRKNIHSPS